MNEDTIEHLDETGRWRARDVTYWGGRWDQVRQQLPQFTTDDFKSSDEAPANPYLRTVVRLPRTKVEQPMPVGVVSNTYTLAQHSEVAEKCFEGIRAASIDTDGLRCELGLTGLGEWMNFRLYFPEKFNYSPTDGEKMALRLECFNSVDGSSRLVILLGWLRFVCSNGMVIGETKTELRDIHNKHMDLEKIPGLICDALTMVEQDLRQLSSWENEKVDESKIAPWANTILSKDWGKKAACRVFHICRSGFDVDFSDPFAPGEATEKPIEQGNQVPGSPAPAETLYDVSQALSWVASHRPNPDERIEWQSGIPRLIERLAAKN